MGSLTSAKTRQGAFLLAILLRALASSAIDVTECERTKGCSRSPEGCPDVTSCDVIATWQETPDGGALVFELAGVSAGYVAVGFSGDQLMANTDVLVCINNNEVSLKHFYNPVRHVNEQRSQVGVTVHSATSADGVIQCRFTRVKHIEDQKDFADLRKPSYIMLARGLQSNGYPTYHTLGKYVSDQKEDLSAFRAPTSDNSTVGEKLLLTTAEGEVRTTESSSTRGTVYGLEGPTSPASNKARRHETASSVFLVASWLVILLRYL